MRLEIGPAVGLAVGTGLAGLAGGPLGAAAFLIGAPVGALVW
jgi:hypothetical protein